MGGGVGLQRLFSLELRPLITSLIKQNYLFLFSLFKDLKEAFGMFVTRKGKMAVRDLGSFLRCLGWNPSERDLEEARQELDVAGNFFFNTKIYIK